MAYFELERIYLEDLKNQNPPMTPLEIRRTARNVKQPPIQWASVAQSVAQDVAQFIHVSEEIEWKKVDRQHLKKSRKIEAMIKRFEDTEDLLETIIENADMTWE